MAKEDIEKRESGDWSLPINNLSGRIRIAWESLNPGLRYAVYLELKNHAVDLVALTNQPQIDAALFDEANNPIDTAASIGNAPKPIQQWAMVPHESYIGFRIDQQGAAYPSKEHGEVLLATGGKNWRLKSGQYVLKLTATFQEEKNGPLNQWAGELNLPPIKIIITTQMLSE